MFLGPDQWSMFSHFTLTQTNLMYYFYSFKKTLVSFLFLLNMKIYWQILCLSCVNHHRNIILHSFLLDNCNEIIHY